MALRVLWVSYVTGPVSRIDLAVVPIAGQYPVASSQSTLQRRPVNGKASLDLLGRRPQTCDGISCGCPESGVGEVVGDVRSMVVSLQVRAVPSQTICLTASTRWCFKGAS